ncbi:MAG: hypothetical protein ACO3A2_06230 [Bdellovibrionia bacterium]
MRKRFLVTAPSNIALVKYMGKTDSTLNLPANPSLSMTLSQLSTWVDLEVQSPSNSSQSAASSENQGPDVVIPELPRGVPPLDHLTLQVPDLSASGTRKVLDHLSRVKQEAKTLLPRFGLKAVSPGPLHLRSANTFPTASGIASSASSFAALTLATVLSCMQEPKEFLALGSQKSAFMRALANLSRQGSGSSCRSLEGPWVLWDHNEVSSVAASLPELTDLVLLVSSSAKEVSSSQAHQRVLSSPLWSNRISRAQHRVQQLNDALQQGQLAQISQLAWSEMWEMHSLFHTSAEPFTYFEPMTLAILKWLSPFLKDPHPPIVTLDAGPNVHLLVETPRVAQWVDRIERQFPELRILQDRQGLGADWIET